MQLLSKSSIWTVGVLFVLLEIHYALAMTSDGCADFGEDVIFSYKLKDKKGITVGHGQDIKMTLNETDNLLDKTLIGAGFGWAYPIELTGDLVIPSYLQQISQYAFYCREDFIQYTPGSVRDRLHRAGIKFVSNAPTTDTSGSVGDLTESHPVEIIIKVKRINDQGILSVLAKDNCGTGVPNKIEADKSWYKIVYTLG